MKNESFTCISCGMNVAKHPEGGARNHCPHCLSSLHVDKDFPGDRANNCQGRMETRDIESSGKKGYILIQHCTRCGHIQRNKSAPDDELIRFMEARAKILEQNSHLSEYYDFGS